MSANEKIPMLFKSPSLSPLVSREHFAEMLFGSRESVGIVIGMINKGYLPTVSIGKYSFINLAILHKQCLEKEFSL
ncbi:hypothetical protein GCM10011282_20310 [Undibacterium macrobrachii]|uniref:Helix-turn-helix domain-containing protein n=1 Tax=Undibacterium macrobrachii TaxID=1119058 RepID=A0ABQ2XFS7_9BURK|nr:hypothetical protein GCM10011282_20310 [Undibacterium macrobrachii]